MSVKLAITKANGFPKGVRTSFMFVYNPKKAREGDQSDKYTVDLLIKKSDTKLVKFVQDKIKEAVADGLEKKFEGVMPKMDSAKFHNPLKDGDDREKQDPTYDDHYYLTATNVDRPQLFGVDGEECMDKDEFYSGCFVFASLNLAAFNFKGKKGVSVYLNGLKKAGEGEPLGSGKADVAGDFDDEEDTKTKSKKVVAEEEEDEIDF